ncbi:MAG: twin-arginine translocase subunit TatB [Xanthomonadales bacterium]|nr:twin-arginine translocase subunit TatB [Xanthomonadales bacterium]
MFDVGFAELFLLALIGLLVLGPERLPRAARTIGGFVRKARASWVSLRSTIELELAEADISEPIKKANEEFRKIGKDLTDIPEFAGENLQSSLNSLLPDTATEPTSDPKPEEPQESSDSKNENA